MDNKKKPSSKKIVFFVFLIFLLIGAFSVSGYYYVMNRFSNQIVEAVESVMEVFSEEDFDALIKDEELRLVLQEWQKEKKGIANTLAESGIKDTDIEGVLGDIENDALSGSGNSGGSAENGGSSSSSDTDIHNNSGRNNGNSNDANNNSDNNDNNGNGSSDNNTGHQPSQSPGNMPEDSKDQKDRDDKNSSDSNNGKDDEKPPALNPSPGADDSIAGKIPPKDTVFLMQIYRRFSQSEREHLMALYKEGGNGSVIKDMVTSRLTSEELERALSIAVKIL